MANARFSAEIQKRIDALPPDIQQLIQGSDIDAAVQEIGRKHGLHIDQMGALEVETIMTMIGVNEPDDFAESVAAVLGVDEQKSNLIAADINSQLFAKIRESMKKASQPATPAPASTTLPPLATKLPVSTAPITAPASAAQTPAPVMPAAPTPPAPVVPKPVVLEVAASAAPPAPNPQATPAAPKPTTPLTADLALSQKTLSVPKAPPVAPVAPAPTASQSNKPPAPPKPGDYTADPYREPVE